MWRETECILRERKRIGNGIGYESVWSSESCIQESRQDNDNGR